MSEIILGLVIMAVNIVAAVLLGLTWACVLGVAAGAFSVGSGLTTLTRHKAKS